MKRISSTSRRWPSKSRKMEMWPWRSQASQPPLGQRRAKVSLISRYWYLSSGRSTSRSIWRLSSGVKYTWVPSNSVRLSFGPSSRGGGGGGGGGSTMPLSSGGGGGSTTVASAPPSAATGGSGGSGRL